MRSVTPIPIPSVLPVPRILEALGVVVLGVFAVASSSCATPVPEKSVVEGYTIETRVVKPQPAVTTRKTVKATELSATFQVQIPRTFMYAQSHGGAVAGQPFAIYHKFGRDEIDVEVGCPLKVAISGEGDIAANSLPGGKVAVTSHFGAYHDLGKAHGAMAAWLTKYGAEKNGPPWEVYISDPTTTAPDKVRTDVFYPIK